MKSCLASSWKIIHCDIWFPVRASECRIFRAHEICFESEGKKKFLESPTAGVKSPIQCYTHRHVKNHRQTFFFGTRRDCFLPDNWQQSACARYRQQATSEWRPFEGNEFKSHSKSILHSFHFALAMVSEEREVRVANKRRKKSAKSILIGIASLSRSVFLSPRQAQKAVNEVMCRELRGEGGIEKKWIMKGTTSSVRWGGGKNFAAAVKLICMSNSITFPYIRQIIDAERCETSCATASVMNVRCNLPSSRRIKTATLELERKLNESLRGEIKIARCCAAWQKDSWRRSPECFAGKQSETFWMFFYYFCKLGEKARFMAVVGNLWSLWHKEIKKFPRGMNSEEEKVSRVVVVKIKLLL